MQKMDEDARIIDRYLAGDETAAEELVEKYQKRIYALAYRMTGNIEDSKDLTQKTFINALNGLSKFRGGSSFHTWLYRIGVNACLNHIKREASNTVELNEHHDSGEEGALASLLESERGRILRDALEFVPKRQRAAVILRGIEGLSLKETAEAMKCSEGAVKAHYHNGIKRLKEVIKERGYEL